MHPLQIQFRDSPAWVWQWMKSQLWFDEFAFIVRSLTFEQSSENAVEIIQRGVNFVRSTGDTSLSMVDGKLWITVEITPDTLILLLKN